LKDSGEQSARVIIPGGGSAQRRTTAAKAWLRFLAGEEAPSVEHLEKRGSSEKEASAPGREQRNSYHPLQDETKKGTIDILAGGRARPSVATGDRSLSSALACPAGGSGPPSKYTEKEGQGTPGEQRKTHYSLTPCSEKKSKINHS